MTDTKPAARPASDGPVLSLIVPMYNEAAVIPILLERLTQVLTSLGESYEIVLVNDGSTDETAELLEVACDANPNLRVIHFSRNFGKEVALTAGLDYTSGQAVVPMDADLQDPPELIETLLERWRAGYEVVHCRRRDRNADSWIKRVTAHMFYALMSRIAGIDVPANSGDFRLMDRRVVVALRQLRERNRFMKGLFAWVGFRQTFVDYERPARAAGTTKFRYWRLWTFALDGITGQSTVPLRVAGYLGLLSAIVAIIYGIYLILRTLTSGVDVPGYASLMVAVLLMGGTQLIVLGIIGEYLGRVLEESKNRPLYIISGWRGFGPLADKDLENAGAIIPH